MFKTTSFVLAFALGWVGLDLYDAKQDLKEANDTISMLNAERQASATHVMEISQLSMIGDCTRDGKSHVTIQGVEYKVMCTVSAKEAE